jgi:hypothetical protein
MRVADKEIINELLIKVPRGISFQTLMKFSNAHFLGKYVGGIEVISSFGLRAVRSIWK